MLMKLLSKTAKTDEEFKERLIGRRNGFILLLFAGAVSLAVGFCIGNHITGSRGEYLSGVYCGMGTGIILASLILLYRNRKLRNDPSRLHRQRLEEADERNRTVNEKAFFLTGVLSFVVQYIIFLAAGFFSMEVMQAMWVLLMMYFLGFLVIRKILERKM